MTLAQRSRLLRNKNQAVIRQLNLALDSLDKGSEALAAIHVDMALSVLDPSRNVKLSPPAEYKVRD